MLNRQILLAHNADFDIDAINKTLKCYNLGELNNIFICTQKLAQVTFTDLENYRLKDIGDYLGLTFTHHDSVSDATVAAEIGIKAIPIYREKFYNISNNELTYKIIKKNSAEKKDDYLASFSEKKIHSNLLKPDFNNANPENPFFNKKVVFTGDLQKISRSEAAQKIQALGADINTAISKQTQIVIIGDGAGPSKMKKINELKDHGFDILLIYEEEFHTLIG